MATLQKVAKRAGVSIATVSKVLSNTPYFTEETREKVMRAVEELGYVPNLAGRALSTGKTHIIALVFPYIFDAIFTDPLVESILEGVEGVCSENGYNLLLSTPRLGNQRPDDNYLRLLHSGYLDGIVALDNVPLASVLEPVRKRQIPAVAIGYEQHHFFARSDDYLGGQQLMEHILALGHRHIGIITVPPDLNFPVQERLHGLRDAAQKAGHNLDAFPHEEGDFSIAGGVLAVRMLLESHPELTAIICLNDRMAIGAIQEARALGFDVPSRLSVVGYDDIPLAGLFFPALTTINQHAPQLGRTATEMLIQLINNERPQSVKLRTELVIRQSSAPPKEAQ